jgi:hypothetical protein
MTFKHTKHWDSELSRSLEKVAISKGLIKPEPAIKKSAAVIKQADTTPSSNLMENIFKLCAGMRSNGLIKEAVEVETNYLNYKSAQTLYEAFKETGDDVIQQAHPDGSHKMEDIDSDEATFEDILDQHVKILQVMDKKPSGKLSSAAQVLRAVKMVLADDPTMGSVSAQLGAKMDEIRRFMVNIRTYANKLTFDGTSNSSIDNIIELSHNPSIDYLDKMKDGINFLKRRMNPGSFDQYMSMRFGGLSKDDWSVVSGSLDTALADVEDAIALRTQYNELKNKGEVSGIQSDNKPVVPNTITPSEPSQNLIQRYENLIQTIGLYEARIQSKGLPNAAVLSEWLEKAKVQFAQKSLDEYSKSSYKNDNEVIQNYTDKLNNIKSKLDGFNQKWLS